MTLDKISTWSSERGFRFSDIKAVMVVFAKKILTPYSLASFVSQNFQINLQPSETFLGLLFDCKTSWIPHIKILRQNVWIFLNIYPILSQAATVDFSFLQLYNSLIRSQLDYGGPIFSQIISKMIRLYSIISSENATWCFTHYAYPQSVRRGRWTSFPLSLSIPYRKFPNVYSWVPSTHCLF